MKVRFSTILFLPLLVLIDLLVVSTHIHALRSELLIFIPEQLKVFTENDQNLVNLGSHLFFHLILKLSVKCLHSLS